MKIKRQKKKITYKNKIFYTYQAKPNKIDFKAISIIRDKGACHNVNRVNPTEKY